jgi:DNA-binding PadR family transcriptional regulator
MGNEVSATTYALLGLLATRSWTGYELTQQLRRSLHFVWPSSEGHLYREQKRLIELGWATSSDEPVGLRQRKRYTITHAGRAALRDWLQTEPGPPRLEIEGLVRMFYGDQAGVADMLRSMQATRDQTASMLDTLVGFAIEYMEPGGPLALLEAGRRSMTMQPATVVRGRPVFPERLHVVALVLDVTTRLLSDLDAALGGAIEEVRGWPSTTDDRVTPKTAARLRRIRDRRPSTDSSR